MRSLSATAAAAVLCVSAGAAYAQSASVQFRIVERDSQTAIPMFLGTTATTDNVLNFAVQGRVVNGSPSDFLGNFSFDIVAPGEPDSFGTLTKILISNADGTYVANPSSSNNGTVGRGGLAAIYAYLAGIAPIFNGVINTSAATFTNTPGNQEIGLITGSPTGGSLLLLTDPTGTGAPATYPGFGLDAPIDTAIATTYLGASANWIDLYRFKYTVTVLGVRPSINFNLAGVSAQIGTSLILANGVWNPVQSSAAWSATGVSIHIPVPAPSTAALLALSGLTLFCRNRLSL